MFRVSALRYLPDQTRLKGIRMHITLGRTIYIPAFRHNGILCPSTVLIKIRSKIYQNIDIASEIISIHNKQGSPQAD